MLYIGSHDIHMAMTHGVNENDVNMVSMRMMWTWLQHWQFMAWMSTCRRWRRHWHGVDNVNTALTTCMASTTSTLTRRRRRQYWHDVKDMDMSSAMSTCVNGNMTSMTSTWRQWRRHGVNDVDMASMTSTWRQLRWHGFNNDMASTTTWRSSMTNSTRVAVLKKEYK